MERRTAFCLLLLRLLFLSLFWATPLYSQTDSVNPDNSESEFVKSIKALSETYVNLSESMIEAEAGVVEPILTPEYEKLLKDRTKMTWVKRLLLQGRLKELRSIIEEIVQRMRVPGDPAKFEVYFSPDPIPNACILIGTGKIILNAGLIALANNVDELAFVIAHEMSHGNPSLLKRDPVVESKIDEWVVKFPELARHREEIRADLGAFERLLKGGFDVWGGYHFFKYLEYWIKSNFIFQKANLLQDLLSTHPKSELRMEILKFYFAYKAEKLDMTKHVKPAGNEKLESRFQYARVRIKIYSQMYWTGFQARILGGVFTYAALDGIFYALTSYSLSNEVLKFLTDDPVSLAYWSTVGIGSGIGLILTGALIHDIPSMLIQLTRRLRLSYPKYNEEFAMMSDVRGPLITHDQLLFEPDEFIQLVEEAYSKLNNKIKENSKKENWPPKLLKRFQQEHVFFLDFILQAALNVAHAEPNTQFKARFAKRMLRVLADRAFFDSKESLTYALETKSVREKILKLYEISGVSEEELLRSTTIPVSFVSATDEMFQKKFSFIHQADRYIRGVDPSDRETRLFVALELTGWNLNDSARDLIFQDLVPILDDILARKWDTLLKTDHSLLYRFAHLAERISTHDSQKYTDRKEFKEFVEHLKSMRKQSIAVEMISYSLLKSTNEINTKQLQRYFKKLTKDLRSSAQTVTQLMDRVLNEYLAKAGDPRFYSTVLADLVINNTDMIQNRNDLDILFAQDCFWVTHFGSGKEPQGSFGKWIYHHIYKFKNLTTYDIYRMDKLHKLMIQKLHDFGLAPKTYDDKLNLWYKLTSRGVSMTSDQLLRELEAEATFERKIELANIVLLDNRVWEPDLKLKIAHFHVFNSKEFRKLKTSGDVEQRKLLIKKLINMIKRSLPEKTMGYSETLELLATEINSSKVETDIIEAAKTKIGDNAGAEEFASHLITALFSEVLSWPKADQWKFLLFLRGENDGFSRLENELGWLGLGRVRRTFEILNIPERVGLLDGLLDSPRGLIGKLSLGKGYGKTIIDHIFSGQTGEEAVISREILEAFLFALHDTGNEGMQSLIISHLLAQPRTHYNVGLMLKIIFESIGPIAIKVGQILAISGLLKDEHVQYLLSLQDRSKLPTRAQIYQDLEDTDPDSAQRKLGKLLGAASIKYAVFNEHRLTKKKSVLKFFRQEAISKSKMEALILGKMAEYLVKKHRSKYIPLATILRTSQKAVETELDAVNEVQKGQVAQKLIYPINDDFFTPQERLLHPRLIESQYVDGVNFGELSDEMKTKAATIILRHEAALLFSGRGPINFDPDRHFGNFRLKVVVRNGAVVGLRVKPIDFGQVIESMTLEERGKIFKLFALAQILSKMGSSDEIARKVMEIVGAKKGTLTDYKHSLSELFPSVHRAPLANYFTLLAVIDNIEGEINSKYVDFVRAVIQLKRYDANAPDASARNWKTPYELFEAHVRFHTTTMKNELSFSNQQKIRYLWQKQSGSFLQKARGFVHDFKNSSVEDQPAVHEPAPALQAPLVNPCDLRLRRGA